MKQIAHKYVALLPSGGVYDTTLPTGVPSTGNLLQLESANTQKQGKNLFILTVLTLEITFKKTGPQDIFKKSNITPSSPPTKAAPPISSTPGDFTQGRTRFQERKCLCHLNSTWITKVDDISLRPFWTPPPKQVRQVGSLLYSPFGKVHFNLLILRIMVDFEESCWILVVPKNGYEFDRKTHCTLM